MRKWNDEKGQVLVVVALSMTTLLGFVGFATDVGVMLHERRIAQSVADGAAIGAASEALYERNFSSVSSSMYQSAALDASLNGYSVGSSNGTANSSSGETLTLNTGSNITVPGYNSPGNVQAIISKPVPTMFMNLFGFHSMVVSTSAIASDTISSNGCGWFPNGNGYNPAITMGGSSEVFANKCGLSVNGNVDMGGNSNITAQYLVASGNITDTGSASVTGTDAQNGSYVTDPMQYLQQSSSLPTVPSGTQAGGSCTAPTGSGMSCIYDSGCNGTSCTLSTSLQSDTIYYYDESVSISGNVSGTGDTIYLAGANPYLDFASVGTMSISPPAPTGTSCVGDANPLCGVVIDAPTDGSGKVAPSSCSHGKGNNFGNPGEIYFDFGSSTTTIKGVVYAPYMQLFVQDQGASATLDTNFVIGSFCSQAATLNVNGFSGPLSPNTRVGLVY